MITPGMLITLVFSLLNGPVGDQQNDGQLFLELSGPEIGEDRYSQTAFLYFYEFDADCRRHRAGKAKLNTKERLAVRDYEAGKPVIIWFYYSDQRTQYRRSVGDYLVFHPEGGRDYSIEIVVEGESVHVHVFDKSDESGRKQEVAFLRGREHVQCH